MLPAIDRLTIDGDAIALTLTDGQHWAGTITDYRAWYAAYARRRVQAYEERAMTITSPHQPTPPEETGTIDETPADDITDPTPPPSVTATNAAAFPDSLNVDHLKDHVYMVVHDTMLAITNEAHAKLALLSPPPAPAEEARVQAVSPEGYPVTLVTRKHDPGALIESLTKMQSWLKASGYTVPEQTIPF